MDCRVWEEGSVGKELAPQVGKAKANFGSPAHILKAKHGDTLTWGMAGHSGEQVPGSVSGPVSKRYTGE